MAEVNQEQAQEKVHLIEGFNGMQVKTSRFLREKTNLNLAQNAHYDEIGSVGKKLGYAQRASALSSTTSTSSSSSTTTSTSTTSTSSSTSTS
jgi:hypothetical protein